MKDPKKIARRCAIGAALALSAYAVLGFLAVPAVLKSQLQQLASVKLHRQLALEQVDFNPFTLVLSVHGIKLMEPNGDAMFVSAAQLTVNLSAQSLWRLAPVVQQLRLDQPYVHLVRVDANHYSIDDILALIANQPPSSEPALFSVNNIVIDGGRIAFDDQPAGATHAVDALHLALPSLSSMPSDVLVFVEPKLSATINGAPLLLTGKARPFAEPKDMTFELKLDQVDLPRYMEYLPFKPNFKLAGARLDARLTASFRQPQQKGPSLVLGGALAFKDVALAAAAGKPVLKLAGLDVALGSLDVFAGRFALERIGVDGLELALLRDRKGQLNLEQMFDSGAPAAPAPAPAKAASMLLTLKELALRNAALRFDDPASHSSVDKFDLAVRGIAFDVGERTLKVADISSPSAQIALRQDRQPAESARTAAVAGATPPLLVTVDKVALQDWSLQLEDRSHGAVSMVTLAPLSLSLQGVSSAQAARMQLELASSVNKGGRLTARGSVGFAPLHADLALGLDKVSLLPLQPYATDYVNLRLTQAMLSTRGTLQLDAGGDGALKGGFKGDASLDQLATVDKASNNDFLSWKSLSFAGMDLRMAPFSMSVEKVALADFFARVIIDPTGRINVQDVKRSAANADSSLTDAPGRAAAAPAAAAAAAPAAPATAEPLAPIRIGTLALSGGRVRFTDNFIRPNYTASLKDLGGTVKGLSSAPGANAVVDLRGVVNSAPLSIAGRINPLQRDLSLDLKAEVRGIELSTLSAYADKYVGYGIEKGKLSFEVAYQLEQRQLKSDNRLMLDQLTFGSESTNPEATRLPVRLAVALLSDRNGVIDINVPVGGSLDDPQFSMGGLVLKVIGNAIVKTVSAPFALLAAAFGGSEEMSTLEFEAGHATITPAAEARLASLARALVERPGLKLDVTGRVDPATDTQALRRVALERKVKALKVRDMQAKGSNTPASEVVVGKDEYPALLARLYKDQIHAKAPAVAGAQAGLALADMEKLMLANASIDNDDLLSLGRRRSQAAKDWLATSGKVPVERIYIVGAKLAGGDDVADKGKAPASFARVDFNLR